MIKNKILLFLYFITVLPILYLTLIPFYKIFGGRNLRKKKIDYSQYPKEWNDLLIGAYLNDYFIIEVYLSIENNNINFTDSIGWNALHVSVSNKCKSVTEYLLENNIDFSTQTIDKGYTALHIASSNGYLDIVEMMIATNKMPPISALSNEMETPLLMAITNNHTDIANALLVYYSENYSIDEFQRFIDQYNANGVSPFIMCVLRDNYSLLASLVLYGADVNSFKKDNSNALHCAANTNNVKIIKYLIDNGTNSEAFNRYGNTPIHEASIRSNYQAITAFVEMNIKLANLKDKDGSSPLHLCCNCSMSKDIEKNLNCIKTLHYNGNADLNQTDNGGATPLHVLACNEPNVLELVEFLLKNGADPTIENKHGWSALHQAYNNKHAKQVYDALYQHTKLNYPAYLNGFNTEKKKEINQNQDQSSVYTIDKEELHKIGLERLKSIGDKIKNGEIKRIICLTGSGISANAGIPPYRTKDGLLNRNQQFSFSLEVLRENPELFFETLKKHFYPTANGDSLVKPTQSHKFINQLADKGLLLRNYTQNVDPLQERSGTPDELIVHAHGSFNNWYCSNCKKEYDKNEIWLEIGRGGLPYCKESSCREIIRPGVVFFGEKLPIEFKRYSISDFRECDCLFVLGTSLQVYPFSGLLNDVKIDIPRVLINFESTGPFRNTNDLLNQSQNNNDDIKIESRGLRDVVVLGDCDKGVNFLNNLFFNS
ncbi:hypothetical protein DICPUDRAFT_25545 [Dictyostelium purpureum]|uniref:Deacetylase sirtuin-type domain-containing protein n=1 Tax=Dictyostelium purpureum TaxID=5786 RepID=F0Z792_DICPU|nr:uncharacterized protein DICPUDRAFT_25545 [Dictyostelium purpureum]EGC40203.1 hypothetical protein DICPUDRAFT_25545 [Dictyostelium purpureum]|eukprot:XP_003283272.1 hypothetical protein DICPUDRAFT_25545 [Dictyostelium purpureum]